jgi:hypothetical protein
MFTEQDDPHGVRRAEPANERFDHGRAGYGTIPVDAQQSRRPLGVDTERLLAPLPHVGVRQRQDFEFAVACLSDNAGDLAAGATRCIERQYPALMMTTVHYVSFPSPPQPTLATRLDDLFSRRRRRSCSTFKKVHSPGPGPQPYR